MQSGKVIPKLLLVLILASSGGVWWYWHESKTTSQANTDNTDGGGGKKHRDGFSGGDNRPTPVLAERVKSGDIRVIQTALGTVTPSAVVTVTSRVNGQLTRILFKEGQLVHAGELLAEIDPRPFQAALAQVQGQATRNQAVLRNSQIDLERYKTLQAQDSIALQQVDAQASLVQQYQGTVQADQGLVDNAKLQLSFTRITSPISGRIGLRQVDNGNNITTTNTIAVVNTVDPIQVVFTLPEDRVYDLVNSFQESKKTGKGLSVEAWDRAYTRLLAKGKLLSLDNQIDTTSGTVKLKAQFSNEDSNLFPNQFVNVRLLSNTLQDVTIVPNSAIQHGSAGTFVYKIARDKSKDSAKDRTQDSPDKDSKVAIKETLAQAPKETAKDTNKDIPTNGGNWSKADGAKDDWAKNGKRGGSGGQSANVKVQTVQLGVVDGDYVEVLDGLRPGDQVVISGIEKLKDNAKVTVTRPDKPVASSGKGGHRGKSGEGSPQAEGDGADNINQNHHDRGLDVGNAERGSFKRANREKNAGDEKSSESESTSNSNKFSVKTSNEGDAKQHLHSNQGAEQNAGRTKVDSTSPESIEDDNARMQRRAEWAKKYGAEGAADGVHSRPEGGWKRRNAEEFSGKSASNAL